MIGRPACRRALAKEEDAVKQFDAVALGELLIDFTENGLSDQGNPLLEANPGGAPCNVLAMLTKLGRRTAFLGKVGDDMFGRQLKAALDTAGIDRRGLRTDLAVHTTLAFVHTLAGGDRDFSFYRSPGADMMLQPEDLDLDRIGQARIFHFGTLSMTHDGVRQATVAALEHARRTGATVSFDPNIRLPLWDSPQRAKECMGLGMDRCDLLKISDNEASFFTGRDDLDEAVGLIRRQYPRIRAVFLTLGSAGSRAYCGSLRVERPGFSVNTVDTCGAGDTFWGCSLGCLLEQPDILDTAGGLARLLDFANAGAALVTTKKGAIRSMPERKEILSLLADSGRAAG